MARRAAFRRAARATSFSKGSQVTASQRARPPRPSGTGTSSGSVEPAADGRSRPDGGDSILLDALLDGMDAALCAFDESGTVTHWNREAERLLGWSATDAVGRRGLTGWALRPEDAEDVESRLSAVMTARGRQVQEFALLAKDGRRVLVRAQSSAVRGADGQPIGYYCAFSSVHTQLDLERSIALSEALLEDAPWGVLLVDADLRPAVVNDHAARALGTARAALLGRPLGGLLQEGAEELESAIHHVLAGGEPPASAELWVTLRSGAGADRPATDQEQRRPARRCWRSGFLRLASPMAEEPVPLGVAWVFQDVTEETRAERESARLRFRATQLHRAARAASECEDPAEAATAYLDFALVGFADHALVDLTYPPQGENGRLVRAVAAPAGATDLGPPVAAGGMPVAYPDGHPALRAVERCASVRASGAGPSGPTAPRWAAEHKWPEGTFHALCAVLRSRGRTLGVLSFLRGTSRRPFDRTDAMHAEDVAVRIATVIDLAQQRPM